MSIAPVQSLSSAATAAFDEFLAPIAASLTALGPSTGTTRGDTTGQHRWSVATILPGRGELDLVGDISLRRRSLEDLRVRVDVHTTLELLFHTVLTAEGHLVCRDDPWCSLESWDVRIQQRFTRPSKKVVDEAFDRLCRGRVVDSMFEVDGRVSLSFRGGPIVSELVALQATAAMVEAPLVHMVRDFDAVAQQQRFADLGVTRTPWGDRQVVLQTGAASLPTTYWLGPSGRSTIVRQGSRLLIERPPSSEWPDSADG